MIRSAYGHPLKLKQEDIGIRGWAFENRVYAEDPFKNFGMPSIGRLHQYQEPTGLPGVRCDSGIEEGSEISMYYDPMICKLTTFGPTRQEAIERAVHALDHYVIRGVTHNIPLLRDILHEKTFLSGTFTTSYLPQTYPEGFQGTDLTQQEGADLAAIAAVIHAKEALRANILLNQDRTPGGLSKWELLVKVKGLEVPVLLTKRGDNFIAEVNGNQLTIKDDFTLNDLVVETDVDDRKAVFQLIAKKPNGTLRIRFKGISHTVLA